VRYLFFILIFSNTIFAAEPKGVQVQGSCQVKVVPDRGTVSFSTETQSKNQQEAVKKSNSQMNDLKERIQKLKLADLEIKTTNYNVYPVREYEKDRYVDRGTKVNMTLEVTTSEIPRLGEAMLEASKAGIQTVGTLVTFLSLEKSQAEYLKCLDIASHDARKKAEQLAKKLGFTVGDVQNVIESPQTTQPTSPQRVMLNKGAMMESTPDVSIDAGSQNFSTNIQVTFDIK